MLRVPFTDLQDLPVAVAAVQEALVAHGVIALPTESFYGLAVAPRDPAGVARVFTAKGRPESQALLVVGAALEQLEELVVLVEPWRDRLAKVWPAPLTVVLPAREPLPGAGETVAVRVPAHMLLRALLSRVGPLTATSANLSGRGGLAEPDAVAAALGEHLFLLLDGGRTAGDLASTLIDATCEPPRLLRRGAFEAPAAWRVTIA